MGDNNPQVVEAKRPTSVEEIRQELARLAACPRRRAVWLGQARRRLYGTHADPADAIQEALTRCLKAPEKYDATLGEVAVWVGNTLETVLTTMRRRHLRRAEDFDEARLAQARAVSEGPERLAQLRESLEYLRARRLLGERFASIIGATELDGRSMRNLADEMGTSEGNLNTYKSKQRNRLKEHQPHLLSLLPLVFLPGVDGANARRSLWAWVARGKQVLVTALATVAVVVPVTAQLTTRAVRNAMPRAAVVAPVAPVPAPVAPIAASPLYARPAEMPVVEESDVMLAVARTPVEPSQPATASGPREVTPASPSCAARPAAHRRRRLLAGGGTSTARASAHRRRGTACATHRARASGVSALPRVARSGPAQRRRGLRSRASRALAVLDLLGADGAGVVAAMRALCGVLLALGCTSQSVVVVAPFVDAGDATRDVVVVDHTDASDAGDDAPIAGDVPPSQDVVACPGVLQRCGASCVDTHIDPAHCGGCGQACAVGVGCTRGICNDRVIDMAVGFGHVCVLHANGELGCWGRNTSGQLGDASLSDRTTPTRTMGVSGGAHVAVGVSHTCVVATAAREVLCWGANDRGQLGNGARDDSPLPVLVTGSRGATAVALGELFSCFSAGQVWCWGDNSTGQLGDGATAARRLPAPVGVLTAAVDVGCGQEHACALQDGRVFCWGRNNNGEAGIGMTGEALRTPQEVMGLRGVAQLAVGQAHACARVRGDGVWCWGNNHLGQLGDGTRIARAAPVRVAEPELLDAKWIVAAPGGSHTCALDGRGRLWCWGANTFGQVGTGAMATEILSPTRVVIPMGVEPMERVRLGDSASCALSETGAVWCWGEPSVFLPGETVAVRTARRLPWFGR